jgi:hypothetical protein
MVTVKVGKSVRHQIDEPIGIGFDEARAFLFDATSGERIGTATTTPSGQAGAKARSSGLSTAFRPT